jgi:hypothetical protein
MNVKTFLSASLMMQESLLKGKLYESMWIVCEDVETEDMDPGAEPSDQFKSHTANRCPMSQQERAWRELAYDYEIRFCGHCNTTTDIKEANFFGRLVFNLDLLSVVALKVGCNRFDCNLI